MSDYQIEHRIGYGGMGAVYAAWEILPNGKRLPVACKVMHKERREDARHVALFRQEAETSRQVTHGHDGLVRQLAWIEDQNRQDYLIMELIEGGTLRNVVRPCGRLSCELVRLIARDLLDTLAYLHERETAHRDISPSNVLISSAGAVKLSDLGLARRIEAAAPRPGYVRGKLPYMAPEVVRGHEGDERADLYSLGAMLYEMLTGQPPFGREVKLSELHAKLDDWRVPPLPGHVPEDLHWVIMGLLHGDPSKRQPGTAMDALHSLSAVSGDDERALYVELGQMAARSQERSIAQTLEEDTESIGSLAGVRLRGVHLRLLHSSGKRSGSEYERTYTSRSSDGLWRRVLGRVGLGVVSAAAIGGFVLGVHGLDSRTGSRPRDVGPLSTEETGARVDEPESVETRQAPAETPPVDTSGEQEHDSDHTETRAGDEEDTAPDAKHRGPRTRRTARRARSDRARAGVAAETQASAAQRDQTPAPALRRGRKLAP